MRRSGWILLLWGVTGSLLVGCEEEVVGALNTEYPFSLWGVLNPLADTQFVRVFPVEATLAPGLPVPLDARFVSMDLATGEEHTWRDSLFVDSSGAVGHVFYAPFQVVWEHTYRIEVTKAGGRTSTAEVEIPVRANLTLREPNTEGGVRLDGVVTGNPPRLFRSEVEFYVRYIVGFTPPPIQMPIYEYVRYALPFDDRLRRTGEGWAVSVDLDEAYFAVAFEVRKDPDFVSSGGITLLLVTFRTVVANDAWAPPDGVFDPLVLIQPGTLENVENGFGFIAGGYRLSRSWTLPLDVVAQTNFVPNQP